MFTQAFDPRNNTCVSIMYRTYVPYQPQVSITGSPKHLTRGATHAFPSHIEWSAIQKTERKHRQKCSICQTQVSIRKLTRAFDSRSSTCVPMMYWTEATSRGPDEGIISIKCSRRAESGTSIDFQYRGRQRLRRGLHTDFYKSEWERERGLLVSGEGSHAHPAPCVGGTSKLWHTCTHAPHIQESLYIHITYMYSLQ